MIAKSIEKFAADETGATAVEYGVLAALVAAAIIGGLTSFSNSVLNMYALVQSKLL